MEFTAGGRNKKIATSKGRLPWDMPGPGGGGREAVASRGKAARSGGAPPMLEVTHEEEGMPPQQQSSLSAREPRQGGYMRIDVPPAGCGGAGPLSAPSVSIHGSSGRDANGAPTRGGNGGYGGNLRGSGTAGGARPVSVNWEDELSGSREYDAHGGSGGMSGTASPHREMELGEAQKIQLWLPGQGDRNAGGAPAGAPDGLVRPMPSRRAAGGGGIMGGGIMGGGGSGGGSGGWGPMGHVGAAALSGSFDASAGPRDSLKLLKRRQQNPLSVSDGGPSCGGSGGGDGMGAGGGGPMLACQGCAGAQNRAVSAAGKPHPTPPTRPSPCQMQRDRCPALHR